MNAQEVIQRQAALARLREIRKQTAAALRSAGEQVDSDDEDQEVATPVAPTPEQKVETMPPPPARKRRRRAAPPPPPSDDDEDDDDDYSGVHQSAAQEDAVDIASMYTPKGRSSREPLVGSYQTVAGEMSVPRPQAKRRAQRSIPDRSPMTMAGHGRQRIEAGFYDWTPPAAEQPVYLQAGLPFGHTDLTLEQAFLRNFNRR